MSHRHPPLRERCAGDGAAGRLSRRAFVAGTLLALPALTRPGLAAEAAGDSGWLSTAGVETGFAAVGVDASGAAGIDAPSAVRLHGVEASPTGPLAVAVGRRPGTVAVVFRRDTASALSTFGPGSGRVFSGHGRFSPDGRLFLTAEIERPEAGAGHHTMGRGVIARRDVAAGFAIVDEWPSLGDGPHDLMRSGAALVVANGGIEPNTPEARDAEATGSSIALVDPLTGAPRGEGRLPADLASLSLRHLSRDGAGGTVVAAQDLLNDGIARPLLFRIATDGALAPFEAPDTAWRELRGYVGSVAFDASGRFVACATPRGGRVAVWHADGRYIGAVPLVDGCSLAMTYDPGTFIAASGYGEVVRIAASAEGVAIIARRTGGPRFDNHMVRIG
ncbi:DUF1513 domain-containing protein [Xanthobacter sp. V4C-4]|uniref:DUF1513 domain-containing protein n=1 Tax=Xanthobacter cornucopiae TaxID=3119924 RepID=UPI00372A3E78